MNRRGVFRGILATLGIGGGLIGAAYANKAAVNRGNSKTYIVESIGPFYSDMAWLMCRGTAYERGPFTAIPVDLDFAYRTKAGDHIEFTHV